MDRSKRRGRQPRVSQRNSAPNTVSSRSSPTPDLKYLSGDLYS